MDTRKEEEMKIITFPIYELDKFKNALLNGGHSQLHADEAWRIISSNNELNEIIVEQKARIEELEKLNQQLIDGIWTTKTIEDLELRFQAARNVAVSKSQKPKHPFDPPTEQYTGMLVDQEIEREVERLKGLGNDR